MKLFLSLVLMLSFVYAGGTETDEKLGAMVPLNLTFITDKGEEKTLKQLMNGKPTLLTLNYYRCSGVCTRELGDLAATLSQVDLKEGEEYQILTVSFSESETTGMAQEKRKNVLDSINRPFNKSSWNFVLGKNGSSKELVDAVGFNFKKSDIPSSETQYTHGTGVIVLSPEGKITRYLRGITQLPIDVKLALIDAKKGRVTPSIPKQLQACSEFHPKKEYVYTVEEVVGAVITIIALFFFIRLLRSGKKHKSSLTKEEYYRQEEEKEAKEDKEK